MGNTVKRPGADRSGRTEDRHLRALGDLSDAEAVPAASARKRCRSRLEVLRAAARSRRPLPGLLVGSVMAAVALGGSPAMANNDPYRVFEPAGPFDVPTE